MHVRGGSQWKKTERRDNSIGPLRRAHPASGKKTLYMNGVCIY